MESKKVLDQILLMILECVWALGIKYSYKNLFQIWMILTHASIVLKNLRFCLHISMLSWFGVNKRSKIIDLA